MNFSYQDFLNSLISPIIAFVNWLSMTANVLLHNYIFITILGIVIFVSLFWLLIYTFHNYISDKVYDLESYVDKYNQYSLYQDIKRDYFKHNKDKIYQDMNNNYLLHDEVVRHNLDNPLIEFTHFKKYIKNEEMKNLYLTNFPNKAFESKYKNYILSQRAKYLYLDDYFDRQVNYILKNREILNIANNRKVEYKNKEGVK